MATAFVIAFFVVQSDINDRKSFAQFYGQETCFIRARERQDGRGAYNRWFLSCPIASRTLDVSSAEYDETPVGHEVVAYYSIRYPEIWERDRPTASWMEARDLRERVNWTLLFGLTAAIFRAIWLAAQKQKRFLERATILDAEVKDVKMDDPRSGLLRMRVVYTVEGEVVDQMITSSGRNLGDVFHVRTIRVAVDPFDIRVCKPLGSFTLLEPIEP